jgi:hypothetical protein
VANSLLADIRAGLFDTDYCWPSKKKLPVIATQDFGQNCFATSKPHSHPLLQHIGCRRIGVETDLLGWQSLTPLCNQALVLLPDRSNFSVQVVQSQRIHIAIIFAKKRGIPVYLISETVPGEAMMVAECTSAVGPLCHASRLRESFLSPGA